jgi:hypothetical protein
MSQRVDSTEGGARASPWPILVAVGLAVSELGVFLGSVPASVAGLIVFGGAAAGLAHDAGYGESPAGLLLVAGGVLVVVGGSVWAVRAPALSVSALSAVPGADGVARRGLAILVAGGVLVGTGLVGLGRSSTGR